MKNLRIALAVVTAATLLPAGAFAAGIHLPTPNIVAQDHDRDDNDHHDNGKHKGWDKHDKDRNHDHDRDRDRDGDRDHGRDGGNTNYRGGGYNQQGRNPGYNLGYTDGRNDGAKDRSMNRKFHYGPGWNHPDRGYVNTYGDKNMYKSQYREGYKAGYEAAYGGRR